MVGETVKGANPGLKELLRQSEERAKERDDHFSKVAESYMYEDEDDATDQQKTDQIRIACIMEYGMKGWLDPRVVAGKLKVPIDDVVTWLESATNYVRTERPGITGYVQRVTMPEEKVNDRNKQIDGTTYSLVPEYHLDEGACSSKD